MLAATFCLSIMQSLIKALDQISTFEIFFFRGLFTSAFCFAYLFYYRIPRIGQQQRWLILRALCGIFSTCIFYFTLKWMPFGAAVSLKYLSPIFAALLAVFIVGEKMRWNQFLFFAIALTGVLLLKGFDQRIDAISLAFALLAAVFGGLAFIFIRKIGPSEHPIVIINYYMFLTTLIMGGLMLPFWSWPSWSDWGILTLIGISSFGGQLFMTRAMQIEAVSRIAPLKYLELVYALLIGLFWFGEGYSLWSFIGILLILTGMLLNVWYKK